MDAAEAETVDANVMQLRTPAATVWRWEMDGAGKGKQGRKSAADRLSARGSRKWGRVDRYDS